MKNVIVAAFAALGIILGTTALLTPAMQHCHPTITRRALREAKADHRRMGGSFVSPLPGLRP